MNGYSDVGSGMGDMISSLLSQVAPELAPMLTPLIQKQLLKHTGIGGGPLETLGVSGDMTMAGAMFARQNQQYTQAASGMYSRMAADARRRAMRQTIGLMTSEKAYAEAMGNDPNAVSYESYLTNRVQQEEHSFFSPYKLGYGMLDPYGMARAQPYMVMAASNIMRSAGGRGDSWGMSNTKQIMDSMFRDKNGAYGFRPENYGGMQIDSVSSIMAALTKDFDPTANVKAGNAAQLKKASESFSKMVSDYAKALAPLQDVFGKDFPSMIEALQTMTGQSLSSMGAGKAERLALSLSNNIQANGYSMEQVLSTDAVMKRQLLSAGVTGLTSMNTSELSLRALNAAQGVKPPTMSRDTFANFISNTVAKTAASEGAEKFNLAFGLWKENNGGKGTYADFETALKNTMKADKVDAMEAGMRLAKVGSIHALERGYYTSGYREAAEQQGGQGTAMRTYYEEKLRDIAIRSRSDFGGRDMLGKILNKNGAQITDDEMEKITSDAMNVLVNDPKLINQDKDARVGAIADMLRKTGNYKTEDDVQRNARAVSAQITAMTLNTGRYGNIAPLATGLGNIYEGDKRAADVAEAAADVRALRASDGTWMDLAVKAISAGKKEDMDAVINAQIKAGMSKQGREDFATAAKALSLMAPSGTDRETFIKEHGANVATYAVSAEGRSNRYYQAALQHFRAKGDADSAKELIVSGMVGDTAISEWGKSIGYKGDDEGLIRKLSAFNIGEGKLETRRERLAALMAKDVALKAMDDSRSKAIQIGRVPTTTEDRGRDFLQNTEGLEKLSDDEIAARAVKKYGKKDGAAVGEYVKSQLQAAREKLGVSETKLSGAKDWAGTITQLEGIVKLFSDAVTKLTSVTNSAPGTVVKTPEKKVGGTHG